MKVRVTATFGCYCETSMNRPDGATNRHAAIRRGARSKQARRRYGHHSVPIPSWGVIAWKPKEELGPERPEELQQLIC